MRRRRLSRAPALHGDGRHSARKARIRRDGRVRLRVEIVEALGCVPRDVRLVQTNRPAQARSIVSDTDKMRARSSREGCCGWAHRKKGRSAARVARLWIVRTAWSVRFPSCSTASSLLSCHHQPTPLLRAQALSGSRHCRHHAAVDLRRRARCCPSAVPPFPAAGPSGHIFRASPCPDSPGTEPRGTTSTARPDCGAALLPAQASNMQGERSGSQRCGSGISQGEDQRGC